MTREESDLSCRFLFLSSNSNKIQYKRQLQTTMCCNWVGRITAFLKCQTLKISKHIDLTKSHEALGSLVHPATSKTKATSFWSSYRTFVKTRNVLGRQMGMESRIFSLLIIYNIYIYIFKVYIYMHVYIKIWKSHALKFTRTRSLKHTCGINEVNISTRNQMQQC